MFAVGAVYGVSFIESVTPFYILVVGTMIFGIVKSVNSLFASIGRVDLFAKMPAVSAIFNIVLNLILIYFKSLKDKKSRSLKVVRTRID